MGGSVPGRRAIACAIMGTCSCEGAAERTLGRHSAVQGRRAARSWSLLALLSVTQGFSLLLKRHEMRRRRLPSCPADQDVGADASRQTSAWVGEAHEAREANRSRGLLRVHGSSMPLPLARSCRLQQSWPDPTACHGAATVRAQRALISRRIHWPATLEYLGTLPLAASLHSQIYSALHNPVEHYSLHNHSSGLPPLS